MPCCSLRLQTLLREVQLHPLRGEHVGEVVAQARSQLNVVCIGEGCAINSRCTHCTTTASNDSRKHGQQIFKLALCCHVPTLV